MLSVTCSTQTDGYKLCLSICSASFDCLFKSGQVFKTGHQIEEIKPMVMRIPTSPYPIQQLRDEVDRLVTNVFTNPAVAGAARLVSGRGFPAVNLWDDRDNVYVEAEVPGLKAEQLDITVVGDELTLRGER